MKRRRFLQATLASLGTVALASFVYPLLRFLAPPSTGERAGKLTLQKADIPSGGSKDIVFNNTPAVIINRPGKGLVVFSKVCTHLGCLVEYDRANNRLLCPCHAGVYDLEGNVVSGPPPRPLPRFSVKIEGENIVIG